MWRARSAPTWTSPCPAPAPGFPLPCSCLVPAGRLPALLPCNLPDLPDESHEALYTPARFPAARRAPRRRIAGGAALRPAGVDTADLGRQARGMSGPRQAGERDPRAKQDLAIAMHGLGHLQPGAGGAQDLGLDIERVVEPRRREVIGLDPAHDKDRAGVAQRILVDPERAHPGAAAALDELEEIRVIDDAAHVGVLVMDMDGVVMGHAQSPGFTGACLDDVAREREPLLPGARRRGMFCPEEEGL